MLLLRSNEPATCWKRDKVESEAQGKQQQGQGRSESQETGSNTKDAQKRVHPGRGVRFDAVQVQEYAPTRVGPLDSKFFPGSLDCEHTSSRVFKLDKYEADRKPRGNYHMSPRPSQDAHLVTEIQSRDLIGVERQRIQLREKVRFKMNETLQRERRANLWLRPLRSFLELVCKLRTDDYY